MTQLGQAFAQLLAPMLAGTLMVTINLEGIIAIDFATFLFALVSLLFVRFPNIKTETTGKAGLRGLLQQSFYGLTYLSARPGLLGLVFFLTTANFLLGIVIVLFTPLVLSVASARILGIIMSVVGIGMVVGSITISTWGGPKRQMNSVFGFMLLSGLCILAVGLRSSIVLFGLAAFLFFFCLPIIRVSCQVIFQKKVALELQGRIFALNGALVRASMPLSFVIAGPLADRVFEPLMQVDGFLASSIGKVIGVGKGHGISLMFILLGFRLEQSAAREVRAGQVARLKLSENIADSGYWLPTTALVRGIRGLWSCYVLGKPENVANDPQTAFRVERREIEVLQTESERVFVRGTLQKNDRVIVNGNHRLVTGQLVRPVDTTKISTS